MKHRRPAFIALYLAAPLIIVPWVVAIGMQLKGLAIPESVEYSLMTTAIVAFSCIVAIGIPYTGHQWLLEKDRQAKRILAFLFGFLLFGWLYLFSAYGFSHYLELPVNEALQPAVIRENIFTFLMFVFYGILGDGALVGILYVQSRKGKELEDATVAELESQIDAANIQRNQEADRASALEKSIEGINSILRGDPAAAPALLPIEIWRYLGQLDKWMSVRDLESRGFDRFAGNVRMACGRLRDLGMIQELEVSANRFVYGKVGLDGMKG